jgi:hypothetical protein
VQPISSTPEQALTASRFRQLLEQAARAFGENGIAGVFGSTVSSRQHPGPTWISLTSPWAYGRLVRRGDGSSHGSAFRASDGEVLIDEDNDTTTAAQLDRLLAAVSAPPVGRSHPGPPNLQG